MKRAYLGLGANLGDRAANLAKAVGLLAADPRLSVARQSSTFETEPRDVVNPLTPMHTKTATTIRATRTGREERTGRGEDISSGTLWRNSGGKKFVQDRSSKDASFLCLCFWMDKAQAKCGIGGESGKCTGIPLEFLPVL